MVSALWFGVAEEELAASRRGRWCWRGGGGGGVGATRIERVTNSGDTTQSREGLHTQVFLLSALLRLAVSARAAAAEHLASGVTDCFCVAACVQKSTVNGAGWVAPSARAAGIGSAGVARECHASPSDDGAQTDGWRGRTARSGGATAARGTAGEGTTDGLETGVTEATTRGTTTSMSRGPGATDQRATPPATKTRAAAAPSSGQRHVASGRSPRRVMTSREARTCWARRSSAAPRRR
jgi:hypothetical protein